MYYKLIVYSDELYHHGVKGMKWGVRRYQDYDGTRLPNGIRVNPGLSMPMPHSHSESAPKPPVIRQSLRNTARGYISGHYLRNKLNKNLPQNDADAEAKGWRKLSDKDSSMHQFKTHDGVRNSKWVSPDGHREVVFTGKGENQRITKDPRDQGTYNFFDPKKHPIGHATLDVLPYMIMGNSADDSTTMYDRAVESVRNYIKSKSMESLDGMDLADAEKRVKQMLG